MTSTPIKPITTELSYTVADWQGGYRSLPQELEYWIDDIEGEIPPALNGTLFRNGPGLLDVHGQTIHHPFDGDGMISAIAFHHGRAHFRNRFVRTQGYLEEQAAGKILYRGVFGTQKPGGLLANAFDLKTKNIANTHVVYWGGKLLALWEAAEPHRLDPSTLETQGLENLDGLLQPGDAFAAHPRIDPGWEREGSPRLVNFSVKPGLSSKITIFEFDVDGMLVNQRSQVVPGFAFLHDFAITPNYCIFFQNPIGFNPLPFLFGLRGAAQCIQFQPKQPTRVIIIPRQGEQPVQILETTPCFVFHHANAFEQDSTIVVDSICYGSFPTVDPSEDYRNIDFDAYPAGQPWRFKLDLQTQSVARQVLETRPCEFPALHPAQVGQSYRYLYMGATHNCDRNAPLQAILKLDLQSGDRSLWSAAPRGFMSEPVFVPHPDVPQQPLAGMEDRGWLLAVVYDATDGCSDVVILDAQQIERGPIARLHLQHHIPYGLHGSFTTDYFGPN
jgi:all-trans-8'-apo-beta-carotenal 15,15'-oxygenase